MCKTEPTALGRDSSEEQPTEDDSARWAVGSGDTDCEHPEEALTRLGGDGLNGYYRCGRCGAGVVVQGEVGDFV